MSLFEKIIEKNRKENAIVESNKTLDRINSFLNRKDIINLDNEKVDALRLLAFYLESKEMKASKLAKFLKS